MPPLPPAKRRARARKQAAQPASNNNIEAVATPSRKRRKLHDEDLDADPAPDDGPASPKLPTPSGRRKARSSDIKVFEDDSSFNEEESENVIRNLKTPMFHVAASTDFANEIHLAEYPEGRQAFAKIAGRGWTFYVDDMDIRIGRPCEDMLRQSNRPSSPGVEAGENLNTTPDHAHVHIDLGPNKLVSRLHAEIRYNEEVGKWSVYIQGRNGALLDNEQMAKGTAAQLRSGSVLEIAGAQMMFVMPNEMPTIHRAILAQVDAPQDDNEDDEDDMDADAHPPLPQRTPQRPYHRDGGAGPSGQTGHPSSSQQPPSNHRRSRGATNDSLNVQKAPLQHDGSTDLRLPSSQAAPKGSPTYSRGLMLESTEDIDHSVDSAKDIKPPYSYAQMIGMAILDSPEEKLTLSKIYDWIKERYAFYRHSSGGWQNSIRHNLSLSKCFEKVARRTDEPGKGMKWQIVPDHRDEFLKKGLGLGGMKKVVGKSSSGPSSPLGKDPASMDSVGAGDGSGYNDQGKPNYESVKVKPNDFKSSPDSTPPMSQYPLAKQVNTPDRGTYLYGYAQGPDGSSPLKGFTPGLSPYQLSARTRDFFNGISDPSARGSPGGPRISFTGDPSDTFVTPLISRHAPKLGPPSTARLPSQYMQLSSPAPFWKYADFGNTPARGGLDSSPLKGAPPSRSGAKEEETKDVNGLSKLETKESKLRMMQSSSPPLPEGSLGQESPTKPAGSRTSTVDKSYGQTLSTNAPSLQPSHQQGSVSYGPPGKASASPQREQQEEEEDDEDEEGIDLTKGFQPIGTYHRNIGTGILGAR